MDMELGIERIGFGTDSTLGVFTVDGAHECFTLEDERRKVKVKGETCIPAGRYEITLRTVGRLHKKYLKRFPHFHRGMLWLRGVSFFRYIYIHIGNVEKDTDGCPLVGTYPAIMPNGEFKVLDSTNAYTPLYKKIIQHMDAGGRVFVTVSEREAA